MCPSQVADRPKVTIQEGCTGSCQEPNLPIFSIQIFDNCETFAVEKSTHDTRTEVLMQSGSISNLTNVMFNKSISSFALMSQTATDKDSVIMYCLVGDKNIYSIYEKSCVK